MRKIKAPKHVWFTESGLGHESKWARYEVVKVLRPNDFDAFLLCKIDYEKSIHGDGETTPVHMIVFDLHNDIVLPDNIKVRKMIKEYMEHEKQRQVLYSQLKKEWLPWLERIGAHEGL